MKILIVLFLSFAFSFANKLPICFYLSSYHQGFQWSDGIEKAVYSTLNNKCRIVQFNMDTKRYKDRLFIESQALNVKNMIDTIQPDVVIASDDNAAKFVISKYYKNSTIPFVFCGINWTVEKYGFPYKNVTGMIEVTPIKELFRVAQDIVNPKKGIFIGDNTITDKKDLARFEKYAKEAQIELDNKLVDTVDEWKETFKEAQSQYDFIILGHNSAIQGWNDDEIKEFTLKNTKKLTLTTYSWMMDFAIIGFTIFPSEQGEWAANAALAILDGYPIDNIKITTNKKWDIWLNKKLQKVSKIEVPRKIRNKAKKIK